MPSFTCADAVGIMATVYHLLLVYFEGMKIRSNKIIIIWVVK